MKLEELKRVIIVHGEKPHRNGQPHQEFLKRLDKAVEFADKEIVDGIVVTGGATRKCWQTEASFGAQYLQKRTHAFVLVEDRSRTTVENIMFTRLLLSDCLLIRLVVISSAKRLFRIRYLYRRLWPEIYDKIDFVGVPDSYSIYFYFLEVLYFAYVVFDIIEHFLPRLTKKLFRNG